MSQAADSAGIPFSGREFRSHPFDGDDGSTPPALAEALSLWRDGHTGEAMTDVIEALCIEAALKLTQDNRAAAAELLGLSRQSLYTKLRRFDIGDSEDNVA